MLDGEVVASDADGRPNFARLHVRWTRPGAIHLWAFDLLALNGQDWRQRPLVKSQARLQALLERFGCPAVSLSEPFDDGLALLGVAEERGLEGVVSKRRDAPCRSGKCRDWRKVKDDRLARSEPRAVAAIRAALVVRVICQGRWTLRADCAGGPAAPLAKASLVISANPPSDPITDETSRGSIRIF